MSKPYLQTVVARYNEDVAWTQELTCEDVLIYNKNENDASKYEYNLPNVGREGHTFFNHIVKNYSNLCDYTAFVQGNPFDHCGKIIDLINKFDFSVSFKPLGNIITLGHISDNAPLYAVRRQMELYAEAIKFDLRFPVSMIQGGQYIIKKEIIHRNSLDFYQKIVDSLSESKYPQAGLDVEKTLLQIYRFYDTNFS